MILKLWDEQCMQSALECARQSAATGEVPVGAIVVSPSGEIIGRGRNRVEEMRSQLYHAELEAIREATKKVGDWRLDGCTLYVTLEPCVMCIGTIALSRIERLVYAASSPVYGYVGRHDDICRLYDGVVKNVVSGVCAEQAESLLENFFSRQRRR